MNNLISTVWVLESKDMGVEPRIFLREPTPNAFGGEVCYQFETPFKAKAFIQKRLGNDVVISVTKRTHSLVLVAK
jgi:hypothetical protein